MGKLLSLGVHLSGGWRNHLELVDQSWAGAWTLGWLCCAAEPPCPGLAGNPLPLQTLRGRSWRGMAVPCGIWCGNTASLSGPSGMRGFVNLGLVRMKGMCAGAPAPCRVNSQQPGRVVGVDSSFSALYWTCRKKITGLLQKNLSGTWSFLSHLQAGKNRNMKETLF